MTDDLIDRFGNAVAFGIIGALGVVALGIKVYEGFNALRRPAS